MSQLQDNQKDSHIKQLEIQNFVGTISSFKSKAQKISSQMESWEEKIKITTEELQSKDSNYNELLSRIEKLKSDNEQQAEVIKASAIELEEQIQLNKSFQDTIRKTIDDANRSGLASSFKTRKDELTRPYWFWATATFVTIVSLIGVSSFIIIKAISNNTLDINFLLLRLPIFASFVWLGWFCTKQFGFISRIREDYSYKCAVSWVLRDINEKLEKLMKNY